jgi:hypothetical protein
MTHPSLEEWCKCLSSLDKPQINMLVRSVFKLTSEEEKSLPLFRQLQMALYDWLTHLGVFSDAQQHSVLSGVSESLEKFSCELEESLRENASKPTFTATVCDCRYVSCSGRLGVMDVSECEELETLPEHAVTHIICDLTALYCRLLYSLNRLRQLPQSKDAENASPTSS